MAVIKVIKTGSTGNGYVICTKDEKLILECGVKLIELKKAIHFDISNIVGCLISHSHLDHAKYISEYQRNGIQCYSSDEVFADLEIITGELVKPLQPNKAYKMGGFTVQPFELVHDVHNFGYYIKHKEFGKLLFITDTEYVPQNFSSLKPNHVFVECNHDKSLIDSYSYSLMKRVRETHMEYETCRTFIEGIESQELVNVCLIHLSDRNSDSAKFEHGIQKITRANVYVAESNQVINLNLQPF